jgi:HipA-like protein
MKPMNLGSLRLRYSEPPPRVVVLYDGVAVAELTRNPRKEEYSFCYLPAFFEQNLAPFPGLVAKGEPHISAELFPFFEERIPDLRRPEIKESIKKLGIAETDKLALLGALSRNSVTDSYELRKVA